jgi:hypothetical protein
MRGLLLTSRYRQSGVEKQLVYEIIFSSFLATKWQECAPRAWHALAHGKAELRLAFKTPGERKGG